MDGKPEPPCAGYFVFNSEEPEDSYNARVVNRSSFTVANHSNATVIKQRGSVAKAIVIGLLHCQDQLRQKEWVPLIQTLEIPGAIYSCMSMWRTISAFSNLKELNIWIDGQHAPIDLSFSSQLVQGMEPNNVVSILKIRTDWEFYRTRKPEYRAGIIGLCLHSLSIGAKCTQLSSFLIELPDDEKNKLYLAVRDFLVQTKFESTRIHVGLNQMVACYQPAGDFTEQIARATTPLPQRLSPALPGDNRHVMAPPAAPAFVPSGTGTGSGLSGPGAPANSPLHQSSDRLPPSSVTKRRRPDTN